MDCDKVLTKGGINGPVHANICSINICGMSDRSRICLDKYCATHKLDILAVQESGARDKESLKLANMEYMLDNNMSKNNGCLLYINRKHSFKQLDVSPQSDKFDYIWALVGIYGKRYIIGTAYVKSDNPKLITDMMKMLDNVCNEVAKKHQAVGVILMGDFNGRHFAWGDKEVNKNGLALIKEIDPSKLTVHPPSSPSFLCINGNSVIDLLITSNNISDSLSTCYTDNEAILFSGAPIRGHVPVHTKLTIRGAVNNTVVKEKVDLDKMNWDKWTQELEAELDPSINIQLSEETNPAVYWTILRKAIIDVTDSNACKKKSCQYSKPYWTEDLSRLAKQYKNAQKQWNKRNTDINKTKLDASKDEFDSKRKEECRIFIMKNTKDLNTAQTREFWKRYNKLFGKEKDSKVEILMDSEGNLLTEDKNKEAFMFKTFFEGHHLDKEEFDENFHSEVCTEYESAKNQEFISSSMQGTGTPVTTDERIHTRYNDPIEESDIRYILRYKNSTGKSFDEDGMHPIMLKHIGPNMITALVKLFNMCLESGTWVWDTADVIFLKKEGKKSYNEAGSYRPISITSYLGKILEKILVIRLETYLYGEEIVDASQEGFTKSRNSVRYLNRLNLNIRKDIEKKRTVACLFLDFEKAFDSVWKKGLIVKLLRVGINGNFLKLIDSFLTSRKVRLHINDYIGGMRYCLEVGLPQGSALSPILFKFFILDLGKGLDINKTIEMYKFADDGTFKVSGELWINCQNLMIVVLSTLEEWCKHWRLVVNCKVDKTEIVIFSPKGQESQSLPNDIKMGEKTIRIVQKSKVLGLIIDNKLNYEEHSRSIFNQLNNRWVNICKYSNRNWGFNQKVLVRLLQTIFLSKLYYAGHVWINNKNVQDINKLWYKIIKAATGAVFNIKQALAEVILGLPPLLLVNDINKVKHYLKINIQKTRWDQLKDDMECLSTEMNSMKLELTPVFKFLQWKLKKYPEKFTDWDKDIITSKNVTCYTELSSVSCSYSKKMIQQFTESQWQSTINNQYLSEGHQSIPRVSCNKLEISANIDRKVETVMLSHFYENNLMNEYLYRIGHHETLTPLCLCKAANETPYHRLLECELLDRHIRLELNDKIDEFLKENSDIRNDGILDHITLLNMSRNKNIMQLMLKAVKSNKEKYRTKIVLRKNTTAGADTSS